MHVQNLIKFHQFIHKVLNGNDILTTIKGHDHVADLQNLTCNNPNVNLVKVNAYAKFGLIPSIHSQGIEQKQDPDDNQRP